MDASEFGFSEDRLCPEPTVFAPDMFRGKVVVVSGAGKRAGVGDRNAVRQAWRGSR